MESKVKLTIIISIIIVIGLISTLQAQTNFWEAAGNLDGEAVFKLASTRTGEIFSGSGSGIFRSNDLGNSWVKLNNGIPEERIFDLKINSGGDIFAATKSGLFFSGDNGQTWEKRINGLDLKWVKSIAVASSDELFAGAVDSAQGYPGSIYYSADAGLSWSKINDGLLGQFHFAKDFLVDKQDSVYLIAGSGIIQSEFLYKYVESEQKWTEIFRYPANIETSVLTANNSNIFFGGASDGMWKSYDKGRSWTTAHLYPKSVEAIVPVTDSSLYAGTAYFGVFYSENNGESWTEKNSGLTNLTVLSLIRHNSGHLYAGTNGGGVFRSLNSITSIDAGEEDIQINEFELRQNYPNPFNPSTTIRYRLPRAGEVRLTIYNILGQRIRTLVNGQVEAGYHQAVWDGRNDAGSEVGSGIYIYRFQVSASQGETGSYLQIRKMMLLR